MTSNPDHFVAAILPPIAIGEIHGLNVTRVMQDGLSQEGFAESRAGMEHS
jgi:hypothetical protein